MKESLHTWFLKQLAAYEKTDGAYYGESQVAFVRNKIAQIFALPGENWDSQIVWVVAEHRSKSVTLPTYWIERPGLNVRFRNNFYDWAISVDSNIDLDVGGYDLFDEEDKGGYLTTGCMETFDEEQIFEPYAKNRRRFSCHIWGNDHAFWMFCRLLRGRCEPI